MLKEKFTPEELEAARKARNAKLREWRKKNPEKVKEYALRHFVKLGMAMKEQEQKECKNA